MSDFWKKFNGGLWVKRISVVLSLSLVAYFGWSGYRMMKVATGGIPVVKADPSPMKERPKDPGGREALYQGLSVNEIPGQNKFHTDNREINLAPGSTDIEVSEGL